MSSAIYEGDLRPPDALEGNAHLCSFPRNVEQIFTTMCHTTTSVVSCAGRAIIQNAAKHANAKRNQDNQVSHKKKLFHRMSTPNFQVLAVAAYVYIYIYINIYDHIYIYHE